MAIDFESIQNTIGYEFSNKDLLQQAFVRRSYSEENGGQNNEVLEFIGDKALDLAVIKVMMKRFGKITEDKQWLEFKLRNPKYFKTKLKEGKFTDIKKDLVEKKALAHCMNDLGFYTQLIMGNGDIQENIQEQDSVKEDLFEAIVGAVTLDSNWNMDIITGVVERMIDFDAYFNNEEYSSQNYVGLIQEWSQKYGYGLPNYTYYRQGEIFHCSLTVNLTENSFQVYGQGTSQAKARMDAAKNAYNFLKDNRYIINPYKAAVGEASYDDALKQINELVQKKMINKPEYIFTQDYDNNGCSVWTCKMIVGEIAYFFKSTSSAKKDAQRECAFKALQYLMDECN